MSCVCVRGDKNQCMHSKDHSDVKHTHHDHFILVEFLFSCMHIWFLCTIGIALFSFPNDKFRLRHTKMLTNLILNFKMEKEYVIVIFCCFKM